MELVSVIIVNHNRRNFLSDCLESVKIQSYPSIEVIVVDDFSIDGSQELVKIKYPEVNLIENETEEFLCDSENKAINQAKGQYVLFLENDAILEKNYIEQLVKVMQIDKRIAMAVGKILRPDKKTIDSTGLFLGKSRQAIDRGYNELDKGQFEKPGYVFGVGQIAGLFRMNFLREISVNEEYFDSAFKIFYEDLDLSWRANRLGWRAYYEPLALAYHVRGLTSKVKTARPAFLKKYYFPHLNDKLQFHFLKNRYMTMIKNDSLCGFIFNLGNILAYELKIWCYVLVFRPRLILKIPRIIQYMKTAYRKRRDIQLESISV